MSDMPSAPASKDSEGSKNPGDEVSPGTGQSGENACRRCHGTGRLGPDSPCPDCGGTGMVTTLVGDS